MKYPPLLLLLLLLYLLTYAPYGINETDGGFITGLAWQVLNGKPLYSEVIYVRPPLPVLLHAGYLWIMPDAYEVLGERSLFYGKVMLYCWLGCGIFWNGTERIWNTAFSFVLSVHNYPAAAWHTVDGILFAVLGFWSYFAFKSQRSAWLSGAAIAASALCKQSFYPLIPLFMLINLVEWDNGRKTFRVDLRNSWAFSGLLAVLVCFFVVLRLNEALRDFFALTQSAAGAKEALEHGVLDYFRIHPLVLFGAIMLTGYAIWRKNAWGLAGLAGFLGATYLWQIMNGRDFVVPVSQTRVLFWLAIGQVVCLIWKKRRVDTEVLMPVAFLAVAWCAAISWGYNFPLLFAVPLVWGLTRFHFLFRSDDFAFIGRIKLFQNILFAAATRIGWMRQQIKPVDGRWFSLFLLLMLFRFAYQFVYRDGPRSAMHAHLGAVFPKLNGIYSSNEKQALYRELLELGKKYGSRCVVLPAFPQADYLLNKKPMLPLDWVVRRESGGKEIFLQMMTTNRRPVFLVEKAYGDRISDDPEFLFTKKMIKKSRLLLETEFFKVYKPRE